MAQRWPSCCRLAWAKATQDCAHAKIHIHIYAFVNIASAYAFELRFCASALLCSQGMRPVRFQLHKQTNIYMYAWNALCPSWQSYIRLLKWQAIYHATKYLNAFRCGTRVHICCCTHISSSSWIEQLSHAY